MRCHPSHDLSRYLRLGSDTLRPRADRWDVLAAPLSVATRTALLARIAASGDTEPGQILQELVAAQLLTVRAATDGQDPAPWPGATSSEADRLAWIHAFLSDSDVFVLGLDLLAWAVADAGLSVNLLDEMTLARMIAAGALTACPDMGLPPSLLVHALARKAVARVQHALATARVDPQLN